MKLYYCVESTAGTRPTSGYTQVVGIKEIPDIGAETSAIDVTPLEETDFRQYVSGLKDTSGSIAFTANNTDAFQTAWATAVSAYAALTGDKAMWWCVYHPGLTKSFFFAGEPVSLGLSGASVNEALNATATVVCEKVEGWAAAPTF